MWLKLHGPLASVWASMGKEKSKRSKDHEVTVGIDLTVRVQELMKLPWSVSFKELEPGKFIGQVEELPGVEVEADTFTKAFERLKEEHVSWLTDAVVGGKTIPEPRAYSGNIFIRTSSQLHELVSKRAQVEGVSMSQWVSEVLAREVGARNALESRG